MSGGSKDHRPTMRHKRKGSQPAGTAPPVKLRLNAEDLDEGHDVPLVAPGLGAEVARVRASLPIHRMPITPTSRLVTPASLAESEATGRPHSPGLPLRDPEPSANLSPPWRPPQRHDDAETTDTLCLEAYEQQISLARWNASDLGERWTAGFVMDLYGRGGEDPTDPLARQTGYDLAESTAKRLPRARTYAMTTEVQSLLRHASRTMPDQSLEASDFPCETGLVYFEDPWPIKDVRNRWIPFKGLAWMPMTNATTRAPGIVVLWLSDGTLDPDCNTEPMASWYREVHAPRLSLFHFDALEFGVRPSDRYDPTPNEGIDPAHHARALADQRHIYRFLPAFLTFIRQELVVVAHGRLNRAARRRAEADKRPIPEVRIVRLRKRHMQDYEPTHTKVEWSHRWIVSGFWRNQWYPTLGLHRRIWVADFVKGPPDKPLVEKVTLWSAER